MSLSKTIDRDKFQTDDEIDDYVLGNHIASGAFGLVFYVRDQRLSDNQKRMVIKITLTNSLFGSQLLREYSIYKEFESVRLNIPKATSNTLYTFDLPNVYWFGADDDHSYMVMDQLHETLDKRHKEFRNSVDNVRQLGTQLLDLLRRLHSMGYTHGDIKLQNIVSDIDHPNRFFLIDLGLAYAWKTSSSQAELIQRSSTIRPGARFFTGNPLYASLRAHNGINAQTLPEDDIESVLYLLMHLYHGTLPWINCGHDLTTIARLKQNHSRELLLKCGCSDWVHMLPHPVVSKVGVLASSSRPKHIRAISSYP